VRASRVLRAMGYDGEAAASAIRISIGPGVGRDDVMRFADAWQVLRAKWAARQEFGGPQARRAGER
jgi:cysteine desulfurase